MTVPGNQEQPELKSSYIQHLPGMYRQDEFLGRFLLIFESVLGPLENEVDNLHMYFDPLTAPRELLPWLGLWMDLILDQNWPEERRRKLIKSAARLYRWRGTRRGLREYLQIYTGTTPEITEYIPGMKLERETRLGVNTRLGSSGGGYHFNVTLNLEEPSHVKTETIRAIIDSQKPACTVYTLQIRGQSPAGEVNNGA